jgi:hypothetical protein
MPIYLINSISTFAMQHAIEADTLEHALDEMVMTEHDRHFDEVSQKWLGEQLIDARVITKEELIDHLQKLKENKDYMTSHWMGEKLIHKVKYNESESNETTDSK